MIVILPVGHDRTVIRRPYVTVGLMALMFLLHIYVNRTVNYQNEVIARYELKRDNFLSEARSDEFILPFNDLSTDDVEGIGLTYGDSMKKLAEKSEEAREEFMDKLDQGKIYPKNSRQYKRWKRITDRLEEARQNHIFKRFGHHAQQGFSYHIITYMFFHGGWLHLVFNLWFFWMVGANFEDDFGHIPVLIFFIIGGIVAAFCQDLIYPESTEEMVGASGAVAGLMGAFMVLHGKAKVKLFYFMWLFVIVRMGTFFVPAAFALLLWFGQQLFLGLMYKDMPEMTNVAFWAHIGGFAFGFVAALVIKAAGSQKKQPAPSMKIRHKFH